MIKIFGYCIMKRDIVKANIECVTFKGKEYNDCLKNKSAVNKQNKSAVYKQNKQAVNPAVYKQNKPAVNQAVNQAVNPAVINMSLTPHDNYNDDFEDDDDDNYDEDFEDDDIPEIDVIQYDKNIIQRPGKKPPIYNTPGGSRKKITKKRRGTRRKNNKKRSNKKRSNKKLR